MRPKIGLRFALDAPDLATLRAAFLATTFPIRATTAGLAAVPSGGALDAPLLAAIPHLRRIQLPVADVDGLDTAPSVARGIAITTCGGVTAPNITASGCA